MPVSKCLFFPHDYKGMKSYFFQRLIFLLPHLGIILIVNKFSSLEQSKYHANILCIHVKREQKPYQIANHPQQLPDFGLSFNGTFQRIIHTHLFSFLNVQSLTLLTFILIFHSIIYEKLCVPMSTSTLKLRHKLLPM